MLHNIDTFYKTVALHICFVVREPIKIFKSNTDNEHKTKLMYLT